MAPLFGSKQGQANDDAARTELARIASLPAAELAAEIMPAFGPGGPGHGDPPELNFLEIADWLVRDYPRGTKHLRALDEPMRASVQALEVAGLVQRRGQSNRLRPTSVGEAALADGSVRLHLGGD